MGDNRSVHHRVAELVEIAGIYARDGAFLTAADRLRAAADLYEKEDRLATRFAAHALAALDEEDQQ